MLDQVKDKSGSYQTLKTYGQDKVLFGTDWPVISPERDIREIQDLNISDKVLEKFLRTNAQRVLFAATKTIFFLNSQLIL